VHVCMHCSLWRMGPQSGAWTASEYRSRLRSVSLRTQVIHRYEVIFKKMPIKAPSVFFDPSDSKKMQICRHSGRLTGGCEKRCKSAGISSDFRETSRSRRKFCSIAGILKFPFRTRKKHADLQEFDVIKLPRLSDGTLICFVKDISDRRYFKN